MMNPSGRFTFSRQSVNSARISAPIPPVALAQRLGPTIAAAATSPSDLVPVSITMLIVFLLPSTSHALLFPRIDPHQIAATKCANASAERMVSTLEWLPFEIGSWGAGGAAAGWIIGVGDGACTGAAAGGACTMTGAGA